MTAPENAPPTAAAPAVKWRALLVIAMIVALVVAALRLGGESVGISRDFRAIGALVVLAVGAIVAFFVAVLSWRIRFVIVLIAGVGAFAASRSIRKVHLDGAMLPTRIEFVWSKTADQLLEEHRKFARKPLGSASWKLDPADSWPQYLGPYRKGWSTGPALARTWASTPPKILWQHPIGGGLGGFAAVGGYLVTLEQRFERETIVAYDRETGREVWVYSYPAIFRDVQGGDGPRSTPTVVGDRIYTFGATGVLTCVDFAGKMVWQINALEDVGANNLLWGMAGSPLVVDGMVIVNPGVQNAKATVGGVAAYDAQTGKRRWHSTPSAPAGYSSPTLAEIAGVKQIVVLDGVGVAGFDPQTGKQFWREPWTTNQGINVAQPIVFENDLVFVASGYLVGSGAFRLRPHDDRPWSIAQVWRERRTMRCKFSSPIMHRGFLFGPDDVTLSCIEAATGKRRWKSGPEVGYGAHTILADDLLLVQTENGELLLADADFEKYTERGRFMVFNEKTWNPPALAGRTVYMRNERTMTAVELPAASAP